MLSFITMNKSDWQNHSYASCCGVSDQVMFQMIKDNPKLKTVVLCLDNDEAGHKAINRIIPKLEVIGIKSETDLSVLKDWNQDLTNSDEVSETLSVGQAM